MSVLETKVKVDETDVAHIQLGDSAIVQFDAFPDTTFRGRVTKIANSSIKTPGAAANATSTDQAVDYEVTIPTPQPARRLPSRLLGHRESQSPTRGPTSCRSPSSH